MKLNKKRSLVNTLYILVYYRIDVCLISKLQSCIEIVLKVFHYAAKQSSY